MVWSSTLVVVAATVMIPLAAIAWLVRGRPSGAVWGLRAVAAGLIVLFSITAGPWGLLEFNTRYLIALVYGFALLHHFLYARHTTPPPTGAPGRNTAIAVLVLGVALNGWVWQSRTYAGEPVRLEFPLIGGTFYVLQAGGGPVPNPFHRGAPSDRYALDLIKIGPSGLRADGIAPKRTTLYATWDTTVFSPCDGTIVKTVTDRPDNPPGQPDYSQPLGNHIVLDCGTVQVLLAHLMKGAIYVGEGQPVQREQPLAAIGNSGASPEPHLHMQATVGPPETGTPVPMLFNEQFLTTNTLFFVEMRVPMPASAR
jgi:hypothetical protein